MSSRAARPSTVRLNLPREELEWILDWLPSGIVAVDSDLIIRYFNLAAQRHFHPTPLRIGAPLPDLGFEEERLRPLVSALFAHGVAGTRELRCENGQTFVFDGVMSSHAGRAILRLDDVTARTRRLRAGRDFIVNAAHEFLSPLTAIAGASAVLQDGAKEVPETRDRFLAHIADAANRLISVSRALLVLARAEAGVEPPRLELVPLLPLLEEVSSAGADGASVRCPSDAAVLADVDLLRAVLTNLVENAKRHGRGEIELLVDHVGSRTVAIDIVDRGGGILPEYLELITERFVSAAGRDSGGFGIGLSIAARAADVLGGTLKVDSSAEGTRMRLELPSALLIPA